MGHYTSMAALLLWMGVMVLWGVSPLFDKRLLGLLSSNQLFVARFYIFFIVMLMPMALSFDEVRLGVLRAGPRSVAMIAVSAIFPLTGLWLYYKLLERGDASRIVPLCAAYPLLTAVLAMTLFKETASVSKFAGAAMIVGGTYLLSRS